MNDLSDVLSESSAEQLKVFMQDGGIDLAIIVRNNEIFLSSTVPAENIKFDSLAEMLRMLAAEVEGFYSVGAHQHD